MKRREFIARWAVRRQCRSRRVRAAAASCRPSASSVTATIRSGQWVTAFEQRLRELGWIDGRTVGIEYRWAEGRSERYVEIAAEFAARNVDIIVTHGAPPSPLRSGRPRSFRSCSLWRRTRSAAALLRACRDRAATSPACRCSGPTLRASGSSCCARLCPASIGSRSWATPTPASLLEMAEVRAAAAACSASSRVTRNPASGGYRTRRSKPSRAARMPSMSAAIRLHTPVGSASTRSRSACACRRSMRSASSSRWAA